MSVVPAALVGAGAFVLCSLNSPALATDDAMTIASAVMAKYEQVMASRDAAKLAQFFAAPALADEAHRSYVASPDVHKLIAPNNQAKVAAAAGQSSAIPKGAVSPEACEKHCRTICLERVEQKIAPSVGACNAACLNQACGRSRLR
jgi:hypothetical protein